MHTSVYPLLVATLVLALGGAYAQELASHPRRALSNKLQRRQILSNVVDPALVTAPLPTTTIPNPTMEPTTRIPNPTMEPTTRVPVARSVPTPVTTLPAQPLPSGIPGRIHPPQMLDMSQVPSDYAMISILFDEGLNWPFVVDNQVSSSQIFAWLPVIIQTALNISPDQVKSYVLQVYIPATYTGPQDQAQLGTTWLGFIPKDQVDPLVNMIKNKNSTFYNISDPIAKAPADHVVSGFSLNAIPARED